MIDWDKVKSPCLQKCRAKAAELRQALSEMPEMSLEEMEEETKRFMAAPVPPDKTK